MIVRFYYFYISRNSIFGPTAVPGGLHQDVFVIQFISRPPTSTCNTINIPGLDNSCITYLYPIWALWRTEWSVARISPDFFELYITGGIRNKSTRNRESARIKMRSLPERVKQVAAARAIL